MSEFFNIAHEMPIRCGPTDFFSQTKCGEINRGGLGRPFESRGSKSMPKADLKPLNAKKVALLSPSVDLILHEFDAD